MIIVKIHCITTRARRQRLPGMVDLYRDRAITWDPAADTCTLTDADHAALQSLWHRPPVRTPSPPCTTCRGL